MSQRRELVELAGAGGVGVAELCRRFGVSRKTAYKWIVRVAELGPEGLSDRSRRPHRSPARTPAWIEEAAVAVRREHPAWGGRKIRAVLLRRGVTGVPSASTITQLLRRAGLLGCGADDAPPRDFQRFEHARPNDLWQMDFKGHFALADGSRCSPLTVLDDHSRYNLALRACVDQTAATVRRELAEVFERFGLPRRMLMDNGSPWGDTAEHRHTPLTVWLLRLDIGVSHGRPYHPQTQGKEERFHRTLKTELLRDRRFDDTPHAQRAFDPWREVYNFHRPHEALGLATPAQRYQPSARAMPRTLPPIEYPAGDAVRSVQSGGWISFNGRAYRLPKAFAGEPVALRPTDADGVLAIHFAHQPIATLNLRTGELSPPGRPPLPEPRSTRPGGDSPT